MATEDFPTEDQFSLEITGAAGPFKYKVVPAWVTSSKLLLNVTDYVQTGSGRGTVFVQFEVSMLKSAVGASLLKDSFEEKVYEALGSVPTTVSAGDWLNTIFGLTLGLVIASGSMIGSTSEMLWGLTYTLQMIYYFPYMRLNFTLELNQFLSFLTSANFELSLPFWDTYKTNLFYNFVDEEALPAKPLNELFGDLDEE